jgi:hypothetical protein
LGSTGIGDGVAILSVGDEPIGEGDFLGGSGDFNRDVEGGVGDPDDGKGQGLVRVDVVARLDLNEAK